MGGGGGGRLREQAATFLWEGETFPSSNTHTHTHHHTHTHTQNPANHVVNVIATVLPSETSEDNFQNTIQDNCQGMYVCVCVCVLASFPGSQRIRAWYQPNNECNSKRRCPSCKVVTCMNQTKTTNRLLRGKFD